MTLHISTDSFSTPTIHSLIDRVHDYFDSDARTVEDEACVSRLLVHEWVANLVQHADFADYDPEIAIRFEQAGESVCYVIEDNSNGFDLERYLARKESSLESFPCRGMGLLMLNACAEHLAYRRVGPQRNRLEFVLKDEDRFLDVGA